jgi:hypothetical protein
MFQMTFPCIVTTTIDVTIDIDKIVKYISQEEDPRDIDNIENLIFDNIGFYLEQSGEYNDTSELDDDCLDEISDKVLERLELLHPEFFENV